MSYNKYIKTFLLLIRHLLRIVSVKQHVTHMSEISGVATTKAMDQNKLDYNSVEEM